MIKRAIILGSAILFFAPGAASATSFNCRQQLPSDMRTICNDPRLSARDDQAAALYNQVSDRLGPPGQSVLKQQRLGFLRARGACRGDARCMIGAYDDQIASLKSMLHQPRNQGMKMTRPY
jgi:uncharacterized protein